MKTKIKLILVILALAVSWCAVAMPQDEKPATWQPSKHVTTADMLVFDNKGNHVGHGLTQVYVYECAPAMARIEPNQVFKAGKWIERTRLSPDVCLEGQP